MRRVRAGQGLCRPTHQEGLPEARPMAIPQGSHDVRRPPHRLGLCTLLAAATQAGPPTDRRPVRPGGPRSLPDAEYLEELVASWAGDLRRELRDALSQELRLELAHRATPAPAASREQGVATDTPWVQNERTKMWHLSALGPGSGHPSVHWASLCGWAYGCSGGYSIESPPVLCERCDRCEGIAAKRLAARRQD